VGHRCGAAPGWHVAGLAGRADPAGGGCLRRFGAEHRFRFLKHQLGWDKPLLRDPDAAGRRAWLIIACYARLWLARELAADVRLPWQRPQAGTANPQVMTPGRVRAGFRDVRRTAGTPASTRKTGKPGPGRPERSKDKHRAPSQPVGKTNLKPHSIADKERKQAKRIHETSARGADPRHKHPTVISSITNPGCRWP
jgi:hypothetical protein